MMLTHQDDERKIIAERVFVLSCKLEDLKGYYPKCKQGHSLHPKNLYKNKNGTTRCKACQARNSREYQRRKSV